MSNKKVIGIDLGSYNSAVAVLENGTPTVIPTPEGGLTMPSVVMIKEGEIKVGETAKRQAAINPANTIYNIKRLMGKTYEEVKHLKRPYKIVNNNGRAAVEIPDAMEKGKSKIYTPEEISAMILQKLKRNAEEYLGTKVESAVITVPAFFNDDERQATKNAGEIAGLKVERILSEPTSASLNIPDIHNKKVAIVDTGGCTTDFSVLDIGDGVYEVLSTFGDVDLGGGLIDEAVTNYICDEFKKDKGVDLRKDPIALQRIIEAAEKAKIELSQSLEVDINLPYITVIDNVPQHLMLKLSRSKFEQLATPFVERVIKCAEESIKKSSLSISEIDDILLVGGSTRIPLLQKRIEEMFSKKPSKKLNPDLCVAEGAAIQAGVITGESKDILLLDVLPISIGLETAGDLFVKMIEADTTIPAEKTQIFTTASDNQPSVEIHVLQGERPIASSNKTLGRFYLDGILPAKKGVPQIEVKFSVDVNGILSVTAKDKGTGKEKSIRIEGSSSLTKEEIERMKNEAKMNEKNDKEELEKINTFNDADRLIFQTEKMLEEPNIDKSKLDSILKLKDELKEYLEKRDYQKTKEIYNKLLEDLHKLSSELYNSKVNGNNDSSVGGSTNFENEVFDAQEVTG